VPRILPLDLPSPPPQELAALACQTLYRLWWQESDSSTEEQRLEIHRLALLGQESEIALKIAYQLSIRWRAVSRFRETQDLCEKTILLAIDHRVLAQLGTASRNLGQIAKALDCYNQALDQCPTDDQHMRALLLHELGILYADRGEIEQAIALYQQSLEIQEQIGNVQGKAATLHQLGRIYANRGEIEQAIALYQQSLEIQEQIGNVQGKAATLHQLGILYANRGEIEQAIALYQQSLEIKEQIGDALGKAATLQWLGWLKATKLGQIEAGLVDLSISLEILERIGSPSAENSRRLIHQIQNQQTNG
jgi:tetratricopeptide (TPR) repeat protein